MLSPPERDHPDPRPDPNIDVDSNSPCPILLRFDVFLLCFRRTSGPQSRRRSGPLFRPDKLPSPRCCRFRSPWPPFRGGQTTSRSSWAMIGPWIEPDNGPQILRVMTGVARRSPAARLLHMPSSRARKPVRMPSRSRTHLPARRPLRCLPTNSSTELDDQVSASRRPFRHERTLSPSDWRPCRHLPRQPD